MLDDISLERLSESQREGRNSSDIWPDNSACARSRKLDDMNDGPPDYIDCPICFSQLPLRLPSGRDEPQRWQCVECGMQLAAVLLNDCPAELRANVRLMRSIDFSDHDCPEPPAAVMDLASSLADSGDRRNSERINLIKTVPVVPVNSNFSPIGNPFLAVSRNVSKGGIAILHVAPVHEDFLAVQLSKPHEDQLEVVFEVTRRQSIGEFYEISGKFVAKLAG